MFADRASAGRALADLIAPRLAGRRARVYGIARGGVIVGCAVAGRLGLPLEALIACKVGAPGQPELAIGAVAEGGGEAWDHNVLRAFRLDRAWCAHAARGRLTEVERRRRLYRAHPLEPGGDELAVLVDDGIATGNTTLAAARGLKVLGARHVALAVPVAAADSLAALAREVEWAEAVLIPERFGAVGLHYDEFGSVTDAEIIRALAAPAASAPG